MLEELPGGPGGADSSIAELPISQGDPLEGLHATGLIRDGLDSMLANADETDVELEVGVLDAFVLHDFVVEGCQAEAESGRSMPDTHYVIFDPAVYGQAGQPVKIHKRILLARLNAAALSNDRLTKILQAGATKSISRHGANVGTHRASGAQSLASRLRSSKTANCPLAVMLRLHFGMQLHLEERGSGLATSLKWCRDARAWLQLDGTTPFNSQTSPTIYGSNVSGWSLAHALVVRTLTQPNFSEGRQLQL